MAVAESPTTEQGSSTQEEQPSYQGSIAAPEGQGDEAAESSQLESLAKIDQATAEQAALKAVPGTVKNTELENENGFVVYGVEINGNDGQTHDVKVDAGNAEVLHQDVDGADENSGSENVG
jgi:uncharacterized membrane protein YkoI